MSYWKMKGGRYGGITARGKRFIVESRAKALQKVGKSRPSKVKTKKLNKGGGRTARRRYKIPLAATAGLGAPLLMKVVAPAAAGNWKWAGRELSRIYTGFDPEDGSWDMGRLKFGLLPAVFGGAVSLAMSKLGVNRMFRAVPYVQL